MSLKQSTSVVTQPPGLLARRLAAHRVARIAEPYVRWRILRRRQTPWRLAPALLRCRAASPRWRRQWSREHPAARTVRSARRETRDAPECQTAQEDSRPT